MAGIGTFLGGALLATVGGNLLGGQSNQLLPTPTLLPPPATPQISSATDISEAPIVDIDAARKRASARKSAAKESLKLANLSEESKTAVNLTQTLLGD